MQRLQKKIDRDRVARLKSVNIVMSTIAIIACSWGAFNALSSINFANQFWLFYTFMGILLIILAIVNACVIYIFHGNDITKRAMKKYGAIMIECEKCHKQTPHYIDGKTKCLYCDNIITGKECNIESYITKNGNILIPRIRPNEIVMIEAMIKAVSTSTSEAESNKK